jgi:hypothetical protein
MIDIWRPLLRMLGAVAFVVAGVALAGEADMAQAPQARMKWDQGQSVYNHRILPAEPPETINWDERITQLLREEPGDVIVTAVGDMIFNQKISDLPDPDRRGLFRIMREADVAYGNLEFSINEHPELRRPFYNFRVGREFAWEVANIGINRDLRTGAEAVAALQDPDRDQGLVRRGRTAVTQGGFCPEAEACSWTACHEETSCGWERRA